MHNVASGRVYWKPKWEALIKEFRELPTFKQNEINDILKNKRDLPLAKRLEYVMRVDTGRQHRGFKYKIRAFHDAAQSLPSSTSTILVEENEIKLLLDELRPKVGLRNAERINRIEQELSILDRRLVLLINTRLHPHRHHSLENRLSALQHAVSDYYPHGDGGARKTSSIKRELTMIHNLIAPRQPPAPRQDYGEF